MAAKQRKYTAQFKAKVPLNSIGHLAVLMNFQMSAQ